MGQRTLYKRRITACENHGSFSRYGRISLAKRLVGRIQRQPRRNLCRQFRLISTPCAANVSRSTASAYSKSLFGYAAAMVPNTSVSLRMEYCIARADNNAISSPPLCSDPSCDVASSHAALSRVVTPLGRNSTAARHSASASARRPCTKRAAPRLSRMSAFCGSISSARRHSRMAAGTSPCRSQPCPSA